MMVQRDLMLADDVFSVCHLRLQSLSKTAELPEVIAF